MKLVAIILTHNEEKHLARCISSLNGVATEILVIDCYSTDETLSIAMANGARVLQHEWVNHATQFNWALTQISKGTDWILRIDADEILTEALVEEIKAHLPNECQATAGFYCNRSIVFNGRLIKYGGVSRTKILRIFRFGLGESENRWMDEHIKVRGNSKEFKGEIIDNNLNTLSWWVEKHNKYASREAIDLLNLEYKFMNNNSIANIFGNKTGIKRWIKECIYSKLPLGSRAFIFFIYRYIFRFGFLDGKNGINFHFLQGLWYRYLVDAKVAEVKKYMTDKNVGVVDAINKVFNITI